MYADVATRYEKVAEAMGVLLRVVVADQDNKAAKRLLAKVLCKGTKADEQYLAVCAAEKTLEDAKPALDAKDKEALEKASSSSSSLSSSSSSSAPVTAESLAEERQKQTTAVLEAAAQSAGSDVDGVKLLQQQVPLGDSTASAYAFLATITKDCGAVDTSVKLLRLASEAKPGSHSYALNFVHGHEMRHASRCGLKKPPPPSAEALLEIRERAAKERQAAATWIRRRRGRASPLPSSPRKSIS